MMGSTKDKTIEILTKRIELIESEIGRTQEALGQLGGAHNRAIESMARVDYCLGIAIEVLNARDLLNDAVRAEFDFARTAPLPQLIARGKRRKKEGGFPGLERSRIVTLDKA